MCAGCGGRNEPAEKFCGNCGVRLETPQAKAPAPAPPARLVSALAVAEYRHLTVLFCDLVGSTELAQQLDAESYRECVLAYHRTVTDVIEDYEAHVAQYLGDGVLAYFGHPFTHEDDAERAIRAGRDILRAIAAMTQPSGPALSVRIGIHSGPVVVGEVGTGNRRETLAMGDTVNIAARLQAAAAPDTVLASDSTLRLVPGLFVVKDLGAQRFKGVESPVRSFEVLHAAGVRTRLEAANHLSPFVGRYVELGLMLDHWNQACEGRGQGILFNGEPGLGKSRLLLELRKTAAETPHIWLECRASQLTRNTAFSSVIELLARTTGIDHDDDPDSRLHRLEQTLSRLRLSLPEAVPLLAPLLNIPVPDSYPPSQASAEARYARLRDLLAHLVLSLTRMQPLILACEDLHWADPSTLEVIGILLRELPTYPMLLLLTARPEFQPDWAARGSYTTLTLKPLRAEESSQLLERLLQRSGVPDALKRRLLERTGGVPLFLEEVTRVLIECGEVVDDGGRLRMRGNPDDLAIPETLRDLLSARIDRLGEAKPLIQLCSVVGREVPYGLLVRLHEGDEASLCQHLQTIVATQLLFQRGTIPDAVFHFKHALIQDSAYASLLRTTRLKRHSEIAAALEAHFSDQTEPAVLALHFEKAGMAMAAARYHRAAAEIAVERTAFQDAARHAELALDLLASEPSSKERNKLALHLHLALGQCRSVLLGLASSEVEQPYLAAYGLCQQLHDPARLAWTLTSLWLMYSFRADYERCLDLGMQLRLLGRHNADSLTETTGHLFIGASHNMLGRFEEALSALNRSISSCDESMSRSILGFGFLTEPATGGRVYSAAALWIMGLPDQARDRAAEAAALAEHLGHLYSTALARSAAVGLVSLFRREIGTQLDACRAEVALTARLGFREMHDYANRNLAIALCEQGRCTEGLNLLRDVLASQSQRQSLHLHSLYRGLEAEFSLATGDAAAAQSAIDEALAIVAQHKERIWESELHRVQGEILRASGASTDAAEQCMRRALEIAKQQKAHSLSLRAAMSLARLLSERDRHSEACLVAYADLATDFGHFTEGLDTADLRSAAALLADRPTATIVALRPSNRIA